MLEMLGLLFWSSTIWYLEHLIWLSMGHVVLRSFSRRAFTLSVTLFYLENLKWQFRVGRFMLCSVYSLQIEAERFALAI